jgi:phosphoglycerate dehydrogenase-like enzyme
MEQVLLLMPEHFSREVLPILRTYLRGFEIIALSGEETTEIISEALNRSHYIVCTGVEITEAMLSRGTNLRLVQKWGSGIDGIDLKAAERFNITVSNAPGENATAVAEHFFTLLFALLKKVCKANTSMHNGEWLQSSLIQEGIEEISGKALGLIGFGSIGKAIAVRARAFDVEVYYYKRSRLPQPVERELGVHYLGFHELLRRIDVLGLALPLNQDSKKLLNYEKLCLLKRSAILINVSRGAILDETDLHRILLERKIAGAGLDVFEKEPISPQNPLLHLENVIVTPHIAGRTRQAFHRITERCVKNILLVSEGLEALHQINNTN